MPQSQGVEAMKSPKIRLNIGRGLLRAWIIISVLWIVVVCRANWDQLSTIFAAVEPTEGKGAVTLSHGQYACWVARHSDNPFAFLVDGTGPKSVADAWRQCMAYKFEIPEAALLPPLAMLAFGFLMRWVKRGFQND